MANRTTTYAFAGYTIALWDIAEIRYISTLDIQTKETGLLLCKCIWFNFPFRETSF
jgi:hypothetical protein